MLLGAGVNGGVHGPAPSLTALDDNDDLQMATDFRRVYASILEDWLGISARKVLGREFAPLPVLA